MPEADLRNPLNTLHWIERTRLTCNNWNPNRVSRQNIDLLIRSILVNGFTQPIVVRPDYTILDGYHRYLVSGEEPLLSKLGGCVPVVIVNHDEHARDLYATITHNRARGVHQLAPMKAVVKELIDAGKTIDEIGKELGMKNEEVFRLSDFSRSDFLQLMSRNSEAYSAAKILTRI